MAGQEGWAGEACNPRAPPVRTARRGGPGACSAAQRMSSPPSAPCGRKGQPQAAAGPWGGRLGRPRRLCAHSGALCKLCNDDRIVTCLTALLPAGTPLFSAVKCMACSGAPLGPAFPAAIGPRPPRNGSGTSQPVQSTMSNPKVGAAPAPALQPASPLAHAADVTIACPRPHPTCRSSSM